MAVCLGRSWRRPRAVLAGAVLALAAGRAANAQHDALLGLVRDGGAAAVQARVRAFALPSLQVAWRDAMPVAPATARTDDRGHFTLPLDCRAALWIDADGSDGSDGASAFVAEAAPGVPLLVDLAALATVRLERGARGAHVRIDGVPVGFVPGDVLRLPAGAIELLVECASQPYLAVAPRARAGDDVEAGRPAAAPPRLRGVPASAVATLAAWPERRFEPDASGTIALPASARPFAVRVATDCGGGDVAFEDRWLEPGDDRRVEPAAPAWRTLRIVDQAGRSVAGAVVATVRSGPGRPAATASSVTDEDGSARWRADVEGGTVVVDAAGHALRSALPVDLAPGGALDGVVRLERAHALRLRVFGDDAVLLAGARVTARTSPDVVHVARTDGRGGAVLERLPAGTVRVTVDHDEHAPVAIDVEVPSPQPVEVVLQPGLAIRGRVVCAEAVAGAGQRTGDAANVADVLLEARRRADPDAPCRRVRVAADGSFVVRGLPDVPFDLFAWRIERGVTWSGRADGVAPGGDPVTLPIACDDPAPGSR